jgi:hypothetical protein
MILRKKADGSFLETSQTKSTTRSFRELTRKYFAHESKWQFIIEAVVFGAIVAISAWPIFAAADALNHFLQHATT